MQPHRIFFVFKSAHLHYEATFTSPPFLLGCHITLYENFVPLGGFALLFYLSGACSIPHLRP